MARGRQSKNEDVLIKSAEMLGWALGGIEREIAQTRERLASLTDQAAKLRTRLGRSASAGKEQVGEGASRKQRRRKMSAEARQRISDMMKKRWAERRKGKGAA